VKITDVRTTLLRVPDLPCIQDATIRHRDLGRGAMFVHIDPDEGHTGLGVGQGAGTRGVALGRWASLGSRKAISKRPRIVRVRAAARQCLA